MSVCTSEIVDPVTKEAHPCGRILEIIHFLGKDGTHSAAVACRYCDSHGRWKDFPQVKPMSPDGWTAWNREVERRLPKAA